MNNEEKKAIAIEIKQKIQQDNAKMLDDLINEIEEKMRARDLSDKYLEEHGTSTREDIGIGEYAYGITMIPCEWIYPYLLDLQFKNKLIEKQAKEIEDKKEEIYAIAKTNYILGQTDERSQWYKKINEKIEKHEEARDLAGEQLTTTLIIADSDSLNYGRIQAHNVAIKDLKELIGKEE